MRTVSGSSLLAVRLSSVRRMALAYRLPVDTWERHAVVASLAGRPRTVLDVGGVRRVLAKFMADAAITTANVDSRADVQISGTELPFADAMFDVATSIDVLEHLERHDRGAHLMELARVAQERVVFC